MTNSSRICSGLLLSSLLAASTAFAAMPTNPVIDPQFTILPNGKDLRSISVNGNRLSLTRGKGNSFSSSAKARYEKIKSDSKTNLNSKVQWVLMDLDNHRVVDQSGNPNKKIFGASSSKIFVGATLLDQQDGELTSSQLQLMANMLVVSSNPAWTSLQSIIGNGDSNKGRQINYAFTQRMGYSNTRGFQGYWGKIHGNELTAADTTEFLYDTYMGNYPGAETLFKLMHTCRTGAAKAERYLPTSLYVGGKTGTYGGSSEDPDTGKPNQVDVRNHAVFFNYEGRQYGLTILADAGSDEVVALLAGGLFREHTGYQGR